MSQRKLDPLLAGEIEKRLPVLREDGELTDIRAALHSLKGSLAMAGYPDLSLVVGQLGARIREGDKAAIAAVRDLLKDALARIGRGEPAASTRFPEPPLGLAPSRIEARYRAEYHLTMRDRLGELDGVLSSTQSSQSGLDAAKRSVHAMKGAAASVGDDVTAWYCHGLESRLRSVAQGEASAAAAIVELARHRAIIALLLEDPGRGIATLRMLSGEAGAAQKPDPSRRPPRPKSQPPSRPPGENTEDGGPLRIAAVEVDRFFERIEHVSMVGHELTRGAEMARQTSMRLRAAQAALHEALRILEPARFVGNGGLALSRIESATATLRANATNAERSAAAFRRSSEVVERRSREMRAALLELRRTTVGTLFERLKRAVVRFADEEGKRVQVEVVGGELPIDRRVADRLYDALIQLAKNAVSHGLESPEARRAADKPEVGTIELRATRLGEWLRIVVEDDGRGVDTERLRQLAVERGIMSFDQAERSQEGELLLILFLPGLTTSTRADLLRGRGLGLDLAEDAVRRLGGTIHLRSAENNGLVATLEVPSDQSVVDVLWLRENGDDFALPVDFTGKLELAPSGFAGVRLAACLGRSARERAPVSVELRVEGALPVRVGVESASAVESVAIRSVPSLVALSGPFSGAVLRPDGQLKLALDVPLLAARAWAMTR
ncbi:MAG: CheA signal transduction histidine kinase [Polyangiaceae bacterium]|nr:CheA signal transduction histidine kinase [Polyangiaceae bacterium]